MRWDFLMTWMRFCVQTGETGVVAKRKHVPGRTHGFEFVTFSEPEVGSQGVHHHV